MNQLNPPNRILMGPGPVNVHPRVLNAMAAHTIGHRDPYYFQVMDDIQLLLRKTLKTANEMTLALPATGMGAMEASLCNLLEAGDEILVCVAGVFGKRMTEVAKRFGAKVRTLEAPWGSVFSPQQIAQALAASRAKVVALVFAETSTGARQTRMAEIAQAVHAAGAVLVADTVSGLAGVEFECDGWDIDVVYGGSQKCLAVPPGISFLTFNRRAEAILAGRKSPVGSWYFDLGMLKNCWNKERLYHHTGPVNMSYALREGLLLVHEEGLENRIRRHGAMAAALYAGLEAMGLALHVKEPAERLATLTTVRVPEGVDEAKVRKILLEQHNLEIGAGMGDLSGKIWRIGLMGENASPNNVLLVLSTLGGVLRSLGTPVRLGAAIEAAAERIHQR